MDQAIADFQAAVWRYYDVHGRRELPWRQPETDGSFSPYKIMVSELMLQQTQVGRVVPKYLAFLERFPHVQALAAAPLGDVLVAWQGLGYNRRAKFLWQAAQLVAGELGGSFPRGQKELTVLPGIGLNTAGAIMAYAYNQPAVFLETNVRTVYIHHFFNDHFEQLVAGPGSKPGNVGSVAVTVNAAVDTDLPLITDKQIAELVRASLPPDNPREWYWALMDYGTHIKQQHGNKSRAGKSYARQSPFAGSRRQVRGAVIRYLSQQPGTRSEIAAMVADPRLPGVLDDLVREGLISLVATDGTYRLA